MSKFGSLEFVFAASVCACMCVYVRVRVRMDSRVLSMRLMRHVNIFGVWICLYVEERSVSRSHSDRHHGSSPMRVLLVFVSDKRFQCL